MAKTANQHTRDGGMDSDSSRLVQTFVAESEESLAAMRVALIALEKGQDDAEVLGTLCGVAHSLKGKAATVGYSALADFAHAVEDLVDRMRGGSPPLTRARAELLYIAAEVLNDALADAACGASDRAARRESADRATSDADFLLAEADVLEKLAPAQAP